MTFEGTWNEATADRGDFGRSSPPEPGIYDVELVKSKAFTSEAGDDYVCLTWDSDGHEWETLYGFKTVKAASVAKEQVQRLGIHPGEILTLRELGDELHVLRGRRYRVEVKQNGEYRNTYVMSEQCEPRPPSDIPAPTVEAAPAEPIDDIPF